jgi:hypothetical protein
MRKNKLKGGKVIQVNEGLITDTWDSPEEQKYEEEWLVVTNNGGEYTLSKVQAWALRQEIASGNRGIVMFQTFAISIPYIVEFYRVKRFLKDAKQLPERATEEPYRPMSPEKWKKFREEVYRKVGKPIPK